MLDKLEVELKNRGFSSKTIESYLFHNQEFLKFTNKKPEEINELDIKNYLNHLNQEKNYKPRSINLAFSSLKFLYYNLLNKKIVGTIKIPKPDRKEQLILEKDEIKNLIKSIDNQKHRLLINLMLTSGLRVSEAVSLKIEDLNLENKTIKIRSIKQNRERLTILSDKVLQDLKDYLAQRKDSNPYLFSVRDSHVTIKLPQKVIKMANKKSNLDKSVSCHTLRSTFVKTLFKSGIDLSTIQELTGNNSFNNIYSPAYIEKIKKIKNPFDDL
jgi:integrase/recombinase XerD